MNACPPVPVSAVELRAYQLEAVRATCAAFETGRRAVAIVAPTGAGKTTIAAAIVRDRVLRDGARVLFVAHRRELIEQARATLDRFGVPLEAVAVESVQGMVWSGGRRPAADLVVLDELHHYFAPEWSAVPLHYLGQPDVQIVGLTATPVRQDGTALGTLFDTLIVASSVRELTAAGHLVPCDVIGPASRTRALAEHPVEAWQRWGGGRRAVVFCSDVEHAAEVAGQFRAAGIDAMNVDGRLASDERRARLEAFRDGRLRVLTNVQILTEGWDAPEAEVAILARGCSHAGAYLQIVGRVLRPAPGKARATVIDLKGTTYEHGLPADDRRYSLEGTAIRLADTEEAIRQCRRCGGVVRASLYVASSCPLCGSRMEAKPRPEVRRAELAAIHAVHTEDERRARFTALRATAKARGYSPRWAAVQFKVRYGRWPTRAEMGPGV